MYTHLVHITYLLPDMCKREAIVVHRKVDYMMILLQKRLDIKWYTNILETKWHRAIIGNCAVNINNRSNQIAIGVVTVIIILCFINLSFITSIKSTYQRIGTYNFLKYFIHRITDILLLLVITILIP